LEAITVAAIQVLAFPLSPDDIFPWVLTVLAEGATDVKVQVSAALLAHLSPSLGITPVLEIFQEFVFGSPALLGDESPLPVS
jgi:hypothetical protein